MSEPEFQTTYSAGWVDAGQTPGMPAVTQRAVARDDVIAAREAAEQAAAAEDRAEGAQLVARQRGVDTSLAGVLARAEMASRADDYRASRRELTQAVAEGDVEDLSGAPVPVSRSYLPGSEYELDRLIEQAEQNHRDLVAMKARRDYAGAEAAARDKSCG